MLPYENWMLSAAGVAATANALQLRCYTNYAILTLLPLQIPAHCAALFSRYIKHNGG